VVIRFGGLAHSCHYVRDILKQKLQTPTSPGKIGYSLVLADTKLSSNDRSMADLQSCCWSATIICWAGDSCYLKTKPRN